MTKLDYGRGTECNRVNINGTTELLGDPARKPEKPYTIILFPGGSVEIARTTDGNYWVHVGTHDSSNVAAGRIVGARLDASVRYCDEINKALQNEIAIGDVKHIAFLVEPGKN